MNINETVEYLQLLDDALDDIVQSFTTIYFQMRHTGRIENVQFIVKLNLITSSIDELFEIYEQSDYSNQNICFQYEHFKTVLDEIIYEIFGRNNHWQRDNAMIVIAQIRKTMHFQFSIKCEINALRAYLQFDQ